MICVGIFLSNSYQKLTVPHCWMKLTGNKIVLMVGDRNTQTDTHSTALEDVHQKLNSGYRQGGTWVTFLLLLTSVCSIRMLICVTGKTHFCFLNK